MLKSSASSQDSSSHHSSNAPVITEKNRDFYVRSHVDYETHELRIEINPDYRPKTSFGDQGDHSTSYVSILQVLLASTNMIGIRAAIERISQIAKEMLDKDIHSLPQTPLVISHEVRKEAEDTIKSVGKGQLASTIGKVLQFGKKTALAQHLADLSSYFLSSLQEHVLTTFYSQGRTNKKDSEGANTKTSIRALYVLDELLRMREVEKSTKSEELEKYFEKMTNCLTPINKKVRILKTIIF